MVVTIRFLKQEAEGLPADARGIDRKNVYRTDSLYDGDFHVPGIDTLGAALARFGVSHIYELLQLIVTGDAEPEITAGDGSRAGWNSSGVFLEGGTQTVAIPNFNWVPGEVPVLGHHPVSFHHRMDQGAPAVRIHNRGASYKFHQSHHGTMFQWFVDGGIAGTSDQVIQTTTGGRVTGLRFSAGPGGRSVRTGVVLARNAASYPGGVFMQNVGVPAGTSLAVDIRTDGTGLTISNDTGSSVFPGFDIVTPSAGLFPDIRDTPSHAIPAGGNLTIASPDDSDYANPLFFLDSNGDGKAEQILQFDAGQGVFVPFTATHPPYLRIDSGPSPGQNGPEMILIQPQGYPDWRLECSATLEPGDWEPANFAEINEWQRNGRIFYAIPMNTSKRFYRLAKQ